MVSRYPMSVLSALKFYDVMPDKNCMNSANANLIFPRTRKIEVSRSTLGTR